ncbi:MAG: hypothetical protein ACI4RB_05330, partial [Acutalibacteraceae bacterium]
MKGKKIIKKTVSVILTVMFILEILPLTVLASAVDDYNHTLEVQPQATSQEESPVLFEVEELREENMKVYQ